VKYYEASGLFRSAEVAARTVPPARGQRAAAQNEPPAPAAIPGPTTAPPAQPAASQGTTKPAQPDAPIPAPPSVAVTPPASASTPLPLPAPPQPAPTAPPVQTPPSAVQTQPPAQPAPNPAPAAASADSLVRDVLSRYESALEARSMEALKRIWPSLAGNQQSSIRTEFEQARSIEVDIVNPQISVSGASATVTFVRRYEFQPKDGTPLRADTPATMTLRRTELGSWVIEQIQFGAAR